MSEQQAASAPSIGSSAPSQSTPSAPAAQQVNSGNDAQRNAAFSAWDEAVSQPVPQLQDNPQGQQQAGETQQQQNAPAQPKQAPEGFDSVFFDPEKGMDYDKLGGAFKGLEAGYKFSPSDEEYKIPSAFDASIVDPEKQVDSYFSEMEKFEAEFTQKHINPLSEIIKLADNDRGLEARQLLDKMYEERQAEFKKALREKTIELEKKKAGGTNTYKRIEADIAKADANFNVVARELGYNAQNLEQLLYGHKAADGTFKESPYGAPLMHTTVSVLRDIFKNYPNFGSMNPADQYRLFNTHVNSDPARLKTFVSYAADKFNASKFPDRLNHERSKWEKEYKEREFANVPSPGLTGQSNAGGTQPEFSWD